MVLKLFISCEKRIERKFRVRKKIQGHNSIFILNMNSLNLATLYANTSFYLPTFVILEVEFIVYHHFSIIRCLIFHVG